MNDLFETPALEPVESPRHHEPEQLETWQKTLDEISGVKAA